MQPYGVRLRSGIDPYVKVADLAPIINEVQTNVASALPAFRFFDDFIGDNATAPNTDVWSLDTSGKGGTPTAKITNDALPNGWLKLSLTPDDEAQRVTLRTNMEYVAPLAGAIFETRIAILDMHNNVHFEAALGTYSAGVNGFGFVVDGNVSLNNFVLKVFAQADKFALDTGVTLKTNTAYVLKADMSDMANVKYYLDGVRLLESQVFAASTDAGNQAEPQIVNLTLVKNSGTGADVVVDYVNATQATRLAPAIDS